MLTLADISGRDVGSLLIQLLIAGVVFYLVVWLIGWIGIPAPVDKVIKAIIGIALVIYLVNVLAGLGGHAFIHW